MKTRSYRSESSAIGQPAAPVPAIGRVDLPVESRMNKGERAYVRVLEVRKTVGEIRRWWFEMLTIRLADHTHHRTDFLVQLSNGVLEIHEVKGRKKDGSFHAEEDAWQKLKIVAELAPFSVFVVWPGEHGNWNRRAV